MIWEDREYVNARKRVFKNLDTNEILNLEIQDDTDNIVKESQTPLTAYNLNLAQKEIVSQLTEHTYKLTVTEQISGGVEFEIPCFYKVGADVLDVYFEGQALLKANTQDSEGHYYEVGNKGDISNKIKLTSDNVAYVGEWFIFKIRR